MISACSRLSRLRRCLKRQSPLSTMTSCSRDNKPHKAPLSQSPGRRATRKEPRGCVPVRTVPLRPSRKRSTLATGGRGAWGRVTMNRPSPSRRKAPRCVAFGGKTPLASRGPALKTPILHPQRPTDVETGNCTKILAPARRKPLPFRARRHPCPANKLAKSCAAMRCRRARASHIPRPPRRETTTTAPPTPPTKLHQALQPTHTPNPATPTQGGGTPRRRFDGSNTPTLRAGAPVLWRSSAKTRTR